MIRLTPAALLLLTGDALAMFSENYRLAWFNPLTGGGGEPAESANKMSLPALSPMGPDTLFSMEYAA